MKFYTLALLEQAYRIENSDLTEEVIQEKAKFLHKKINAMDSYWKRTSRRFHKMNKLE